MRTPAAKVFRFGKRDPRVLQKKIFANQVSISFDTARAAFESSEKRIEERR